uniref:SFRICE026680.2 n=1 Tax=Spodoptera frugiperda TaxID=7108 RepID=A0A2H1WV93_SPOFR
MDVIILNLLCIFISGSLTKADRTDIETLTSCIVKLLQQVDYKTYDKVMDITVMNMNNDLQLSALHQVEGARFISRKFFWNTEYISNVIYIVMSEDYQELADGLNKVTSDKYWNPSARFIIVVQNLKEYSLHDLTHLLHTYNIFHKVSVISRDSDMYAIYRYNFTKPGNCFRAGHLIFWSWCSDYTAGKKLAFLTEGSIRNCRFQFIAQNLWPFMNFDNDVKGSEQFSLAMFQKQYSVQIHLNEFTKFNKYGKPVDNLRKLIHNKVVHNEYEGAVGGFAINSEYSGNISHVYPMTIDHMFYTLARSNHVEQWVAVLNQSFSTFIVIGIIFVIFCVAATCLSIFHTRQDISGNVLIVFGYILNKNFVKRTPSGWTRALIFLTLLFTGLIIPYAIQANLYSVTTRPARAFEPKKSDDLKGYRAILYTDWQRIYARSNYSFCGTRLNCLLMVKNCQNRSLFTIVSDAHYQVHRWQLTDHQCKMLVYQIKDPYISIYRTVYLRRGSVLIEPLNNFTLQFESTGIMNKYLSEIYYKNWLKCKPRHRPDHVSLRLANFYNVFKIFLGGCCLSILIFLCEIFIGIIKTKLNRTIAT